ncbi:MAG: protoporphyrinogen oxidase [Candidatus Eremiobacteraeota bacterium]|nr:protoporphyrinogen oxidase [Candidatus Eremiobacteraeota bacterium]
MRDNFQPVDVAVVGGGVSGLTCAFWLKRAGLNVTLFEASRQAGGCIQSLRTAPYIADGGPQSFLANAELLELVRTAGLESALQTVDPVALRPYFFHKGRLVEVPRSPPAVLKTPLLSAGAKLRLLGEPLIAARTQTSDESIASFVCRRAGRELLGAVIAPYVSGIFAGDPAKLSMSSVFPSAVALERSHGSVLRGFLSQRQAAKAEALAAGGDGKPVPRKTVGFRGGNDALPNALAEQLGRDLRLGVSVKAMWQRGNWLELQLADAGQTRVVARSVVIATPAANAAQLLQIFNPQLGAQLEAIGHPPVVQIALAYPRSAVGVPLEGFGFLAARQEKLRILGCVFNSVMFPDRCPENELLLTVFLGGATDPQIYDSNDAELTRIAHADLQRVLKIADTRPTIVAGFRWPFAIPQFNIGHAQRVQSIQDAAATIPHLYLCGNYLANPSVGALVGSAKTLASTIVEDLKKEQSA